MRLSRRHTLDQQPPSPFSSPLSPSQIACCVRRPSGSACPWVLTMLSTAMPANKHLLLVVGMLQVLFFPTRLHRLKRQRTAGTDSYDIFVCMCKSQLQRMAFIKLIINYPASLLLPIAPCFCSPIQSPDQPQSLPGSPGLRLFAYTLRLLCLQVRENLRFTAYHVRHAACSMWHAAYGHWPHVEKQRQRLSERKSESEREINTHKSAAYICKMLI